MTESLALVRRAFLLRALGPTLATALAYVAGARLGLLFSTNFDVSPFWPATGIAVAFLLRRGLRGWPGIALGAVALELGLDGPRAAVLIVVGDVLAPVLTVWLLQRVRFQSDFLRLRDAAVFVAAALVGMTVSSGLGTVGLTAAGPVTADQFWPTWWIWWAGDATGVLVVTPVLLLSRHLAQLVRDLAPGRLLEWLGIQAFTAALAWLSLSAHGGMEFVALPGLIWAALRFGMAGAAPAAFLVAVLADVAAAIPVGDLAEGSTVARMYHLQSFTGVCALTALVVAGLSTQRWHERQRAERVLEAAVAERTAELSAGLQRLAASEALLADAQRVGRVGSFEFDVDTGAVRWSAEMSRLWGRPAERRAAEEADYVAGLHPDDRDQVLVVIGNAMRSRTPYELTHRVLWPDGSVRWLHCYGSFRVDGERALLLGTAQDVTEARAAAEALRRKNADDLAIRHESERALLDALEQQRAATARLREVDRMRSEVVATVSHELRTPLTAITGFLELLLEDEDDPGREPLLAAAHRSAIRLSALVEDLLSTARIEAAGAGSGEPDVVVDLGTVVREAVASVAQIFMRRGQTLTVEPADPGSWPVAGDERQLDRVLVNLLSNASKYTPEGGRVELHVTPQGRDVAIAITDTGIGIPTEEHDRLFDRFYRASTAGDSPGTGLGLSIVKTIVDRHGGRVQVHSAPGCGSTFTVTLPLAQQVGAGVR